MKNSDVELINRILAGNDSAFADLVRKYQKQVHALAWRKIGDFHIAEEITQDTFLKVYQKLPTLRNPNQFSGWLYVIATRQCLAYLRKKSIDTESLEEMETDMIVETAYSQYVAAEQAKVNADAQRKVVKKLLAKLKESERTVMVLHYFGDMTCSEISRFLGVSPSAIKSRLSRARQRLKKEEPMITEALSNFQISANLTENIMKEIANLQPVVSSGSHPSIPWMLAASGAILIVLILGLGSQQLARFQQPYSLDMESEMTVELIDSPIVQNVDTKHDVRNPQGNSSDISGTSNGAEQESNQVLTEPGDYTQWELPKGAKARLGKGAVTGNISFSPDGTRLAVASAIGIWIYDARPGKVKELNLITGHPYDVTAIAFSPDGITLASGSRDASIRLWDARTATHLATLVGHQREITAVAFSPDGNTLATGDGVVRWRRTEKEGIESEVRVWNKRTGKLITVLKGHTQSIYCVAFSPDGMTIATGSADKTARLWNAHTGQHLATLTGPSKLKSHLSTVSSIAYSPDGKNIATGCLDNSLRLWDAQSGELITKIKETNAGIYSLAFSPDGKTIATGSNDVMRLWNAHTGEQKATLSNHIFTVTSVAFSPDGKTLATTGWDNTVKLWNTQTGKLRTTIKGHASLITSVAYSPDGKILATTNWDKMGYVWDVHARQLKTVLKGHSSGVEFVTYSPDGRTIATTSADKTIRLWDAQTEKYINTLSGHTERVSSAVFSPDGNILASGSWDKTLRLWHIPTREQIATITGHTRIIKAVTFSPDGNTLASGSYDGTVRLWDVHSQEHVATYQGHIRGIYSVAFSPDSNIIASGGAGNSVILWNTRTAKQIVQLPTDRTVTSIAFSPEGTILAIGSRDGTVRLWQTDTWKDVTILTGHRNNDSVFVAFSPDGTTIASGSDDGTILLWPIR